MQYPDVPAGMLEAVAWNNSRLVHLDEPEGCLQMPRYRGVMGLVADGKGYFRENLKLVSRLSGISEEDILTNPTQHILAYAAAFSFLHDSLNLPVGNHESALPVLVLLSEIPIDGNLQNDFALNSQLYGIYTFLNDANMQNRFGFGLPQELDLEKLFGAANYKVLSAPGVRVSSNGIKSNNGQPYGQSRLSTDYGPALWNPAASCNYSTRGGAAISAVTVHTIQGSYAGAISWFQNCNAGVSAHYVLRSSDGQVTQMVLEGEKAWHVGSENGYTIGLEHEGYVSDPTWYTTSMYQSSANLVKDIVNSGYGMNPLSCYKGSAQVVLNACYQIKGHIHYPNQTHTDPGVHWNWPYYHSLINDTIKTTRLYTCNGTFTDAGGANNYPDLTKYLTIIEPIGADSITMNFTSFTTEQGYDSLYIFDGDNVQSPLIGAYTGTQNPGTVVARSGKMALLFTSDCIVNGVGWLATWQCGTCTPFYVEVDDLDDATCTAGGSVQVSAVGVSGGVSYLWHDGATDSVRTNLLAGTYTVSATLANNCGTERTVVIGQADTLDYTVLHNDISCYDEHDGVAGVVVTQGSFPISYNWSNGYNGAVQTGLGDGNYAYTITDDNGCIGTGYVDIDQPTALNALPGFTLNPVTDSITGGTRPYTVDAWNVCDTTIDGIIVCQYALTDANGCAWDTTVLKGVLAGLSSPEKLSVGLYPNPVNEELTIILPTANATFGHFSVINSIGVCVHRQEINSSNGETFRLHTRKYPSGMYFVFFRMGEQVYTGKFNKL